MSKESRLGLIALAIVGGAGLVVLLGAAAVVMANRTGTNGPQVGGSGDVLSGKKPRADREGVEWTHKELVAYLEKNGIPLSEYKTDAADPNGPSVEYFSGNAAVGIQRCPTPEKAREIAGLGDHRHFAWGRFALFFGNDVISKAKPLFQ